MKYLKFILPAIVTITTIMGMVAAHYNGNDAAFSANLTAAIGWLILTTNEFISFLNERKQSV